MGLTLGHTQHVQSGSFLHRTGKKQLAADTYNMFLDSWSTEFILSIHFFQQQSHLLQHSLTILLMPIYFYTSNNRRLGVQASFWLLIEDQNAPAPTLVLCINFT